MSLRPRFPRLCVGTCRLVLIVIAYVGSGVNDRLFADEIDNVFDAPAPIFCGSIEGETQATIRPVVAASETVEFSRPDDVGGQLERFSNDDTLPCTCCFDLKSDLHGFLPALRDDACAIVNWNNAGILGGALATSLAFRQNLDDRVRRNTARHPDRWGEGSKTLGQLGEVQYHVAAMAVLYGISVKRCDGELHSFVKTLVSAYTINGFSTMTVKGIANTDRPSDEWNGGQFGFPSFHASSSFTIAAVVDEYYGPKAGLPAYALAGLISWSRIDERDHDLSDVFFGAAMGYVIGHAVAGQHLRCDSRVRLLPYFHPTEGTSGLMVDCSF